MLLRRKAVAFDRTATLAEGDRARARGRRRKAIAAYRKVLAADPKDTGVHGKIAPLLARTGKRTEALASFRAASEGQVRAGFVDRALSVLRQASDFYPEELGLWEEIARLHVQRGRRADAVAALVGAGGRLLRTRHRPVAVSTLRRALEIEPWQPDATLLLARVLAKEGRRDDALALVEGLATRVRGKVHRRARALAFRISPTLGNLWRWMRARFGAR
ncbi:MAG TPA: tetratricopeptide repeat protein [Anaeromyxobacter sp.]